MSEQPSFLDERIDDLPLLYGQLEKMGVARILDEHFPPRRNWKGLSLGQIATVWMCFILSESDHCLNHLQTWAEQRLTTLSALVGRDVRGLDFSDDRLASILDRLAEPARWRAAERDLGSCLIRVYDLACERIRLDSTTALSYRDVNEDGYFTFGYSKDHRPDLPQVKIQLATLDPLGLPLLTTCVSGKRSDEKLYRPDIEALRAVLGRRGLVYVGDSKMGKLATRAFIAAGNDFYLCPLAANELPLKKLDALLDGFQAAGCPAPDVERVDAAGRTSTVARGFEVEVAREADVDGQTTSWSERLLVLCSLARVESGQKKFDEALSRAVKRIEDCVTWRRGKAKARDCDKVRRRIETILKQERMQDILEVAIWLEEVPARGGRVESEARVAVTINEEVRARARRRIGWRVYATNADASRISIEEAVNAYRDSYIIERNFARLKGKPLSLTPMYLQSETRILGLIRLLTLCSRVLTLVEFVVRRALSKGGASTMKGLYPSNPQRASSRPSTELLLKAFQYITVIVMVQGPMRVVHLAPLSKVQQHILRSLDLPEDLYQSLVLRIVATSQKMSEP